MVGTLIRGVLALVSLAVFVAITVSEDDLAFLIPGVIFVAVLWGLGRKRRRRRRRGNDGAAYDWGNNDDGGGWLEWGDGGGDGGGGNGGGD